MNHQPRQPKGPCFNDLKDKVALVTGGGTGIGRGICLRLAQEGMKVVLCGRRQEKLDETVELVKEIGGTATPIACDIAEPEQVDELYKQVIAEYGTVDLLVHNAAEKFSGTFQSTSLEDWRRVMATNIDAAFYLSRKCTDVMLSNGSGGIVFVSTIGAFRGHYKMLAYDCSKGAMEALIRGMAIELARFGIRVNGVAPGATAIRKAAFEDPIPVDKLEHPNVPLGRSGTPEEMAAAVAFLASEQAAYIIGQTLVVDGGALAQLSPRGAWI